MFPRGGMKGLMKQAQEMQKKMKKMENELKELRIKGSASGKLVEVEANGKKEIISIFENINIIQDKTFELKKFNKELFITKYRPYINRINPGIDFNLINKIETVTLIKFIAMSCPFSSADKQMLLETFNLNDLAHKLITLFEYYSSTSKNERSVN